MLAIRSVAAAIALLLPAAASAAPARETQNVPQTAVEEPLAAGSLEGEIDFGPTLERQALVAAVLARNPSLEAARQAHRAALERPAQARALVDPELTYWIAPLSVGGGSVPFGQSVEVGQMLPYPGKRRLRGEAAEAEAEAAGLGVEELRLELALVASHLFDDYWLVARSLEINQEHERLLGGFLEIATARYAAGLLPQQAPLQAEAELAHVLHQGLVLGREQREVAARLNALLHRPPAAPLPPPPALMPPVPPVPHVTPRALVDQALARRPELSAAGAEIAALEAGAGLARLARRPDFGVMGSYSSMYMDTEHQWMVGLSVNLPVRRERLRAAEAEAEARVGAAEAQRLALADSIRVEVQTAWERVSESHHVIDLIRARSLPASRDQVQAALAAVETGRGSFLDLIAAERNLRHFELHYHQAIAEYNRRVAELQRLVGELPRLPLGADGLQPGASLSDPSPPADSSPPSDSPGDSP